MNIYAKLNAARAAFHRLELKKSGHNKFSDYRYFELGDFLIPAMTVLAEHGLCAYVSFEADLAHITVCDTESSECFCISSPMGSAALKGCHEVQNIGAVETYQRRYLWSALLEVIEHDSIDQGAAEPQPQTSAEPSPKVLEAIAQATTEIGLRELWNGLHVDMRKACRQALKARRDLGFAP